MLFGNGLSSSRSVVGGLRSGVVPPMRWVSGWGPVFRFCCNRREKNTSCACELR